MDCQKYYCKCYERLKLKMFLNSILRTRYFFIQQYVEKIFLKDQLLARNISPLFFIYFAKLVSSFYLLNILNSVFKSNILFKKLTFLQYHKQGINMCPLPKKLHKIKSLKTLHNRSLFFTVIPKYN